MCIRDSIRERSQAKIVRFVQTSAPEATTLQFPEGFLLFDNRQPHPDIGVDSGAGPEHTPEAAPQGSPQNGQPVAKARPRGKSGRCRICGRHPNRLIPCKRCKVRMGGGCCAVSHAPGAQDGICYICHSQLQEQAANPPYRTGLPPRQQKAGGLPHWTEIVNRLAVASQSTADTEDGESDDAEWLMSVHGQPSGSEADRATASAHAPA